MKKRSILLGIILMSVLLLTVGCQVQPDPGKSILVTDYDADGNIIQQETVPFAVASSSLQALTVPPEFEYDYIQRSLPDVPAGAVTRSLQIIITNTGNIDTDIEVSNAQFQAEYIQG